MEFLIGKSGAEGRRAGRKLAAIGCVSGSVILPAAGRDDVIIDGIDMLAIPVSLNAGRLITFIFQV